MLPSGRSAMICRVFWAPPMMRRRTSLKPACSMTGSNTGSRCCAAVKIANTPKSKSFPRGGLATATQQTVLFGMGAIYARSASKTSRSVLFGRRDAHFDLARGLRGMDGLLAVGLFGLLDMFIFDPVQHIVGLVQPCQIDPEQKGQKSDQKHHGHDHAAPVAPMAAELNAFVLVFFPNHGFTLAVRRKRKKTG